MSIQVDEMDSGEKRLNELGYKQELRREMTLFKTLAISFSTMTLFTGITPLYGSSLQYAGPAALVWGWVVVSFFTWFVGIAMAEICSSFPTTGSLYFWAAHLAGPKWGPFASWCCAWLETIGLIAGIGTQAYAGSQTLQSIILLCTGTNKDGGYLAPKWLFLCMYVGLTVIWAFLNTFALEVIAFIDIISIWWQVIGGTVIVIMLPLVATTRQSASYVFTSFELATESTGISNKVYAAILALLVSQYSLYGYDAAAHLTEETKGADKNGPIAILSSIGIISIFGWAYILALTFSIQVCWEKFANYFEVELKEVKLREGYYVMDPVKAVELVDENTICVAAILGSTLNGEFEDVKLLNDLLIEKNKQTGWDTPIHVDAASGGFIAPFIYPELEWDFRLPLVKSINVSGHKYGLVYAGIGWVIWRTKQDLPDELIFHINYLGADQPTFTLNFSKGSSQIIAQYYQLIRLGFEGYQNVMENCRQNAVVLKQGLEKTGRFNIVSKDIGVPLVAFSLKDNSRYNEFEVSDMLRRFGWIVPAYSMPADAQHVTVLRVVIREDFSRTLAERLVFDICKVLHELDAVSSKISAKMEENGKNGTVVKKTALQTQREITDVWKKFVLARKTQVIC